MPLVRSSTTFSLRAIMALRFSFTEPSIDAMGRETVVGFLEFLGTVQQRLGRNAAYIQAGAAQRAALFNAGHLQAELRRANGRDIAAGAAADDNKIVLGIAHGVWFLQRRNLPHPQASYKKRFTVNIGPARCDKLPGRANPTRASIAALPLDGVLHGKLRIYSADQGVSPMFKTLDDLDLNGKRVLLRGDLNVPVADGKVADATRIERLAPTINELCGKGAKVIVMSHFGRPKGKVVPEMSLEPVDPALSAALGGKAVAFAPDCVGPDAAAVVEGLSRAAWRCWKICASTQARRPMTPGLRANWRNWAMPM